MQEVRDALLVMQTQWQLLAKSAETELETCRVATQQMNAGIEKLQTSSQALGEGVEVTAVAAKQLKETRLEVMRDRKLSIEVAESVRDRLAVDSSSVETCLVFANALETALNKWNDNVRHLDQLREVFIQASITGRNDDTQALQRLKEETEALIRSLQNSINADLGAAISTKAADIQRLGEPITRAQELSNGVVLQLLDLQARLNAATEDRGKQGLWGQGGNT